MSLNDMGATLPPENIENAPRSVYTDLKGNQQESARWLEKTESWMGFTIYRKHWTSQLEDNRGVYLTEYLTEEQYTELLKEAKENGVI